MIKNLLFLIAVLFIFSSCDPSDEIPEPEKKYYLQSKVSKVTTGGTSFTIDLNYHYNEQKQLARITGTSPNSNRTSVNQIDIVYSYDEQNRLVKIQRSPQLSWTLTYNEKNQVEKQIRTYTVPNQPVGIHYYKNTYNEAEKLIKTEVRNIVDGVDTPGIIYTYTYTGNQITYVKGDRASGGTYHDFSFAYDDKKVPLKGVYQLSVPRFWIDETPNQILSDHNVISLSKTFTPRADYSLKATYTYNEAGYPLTSVREFMEGSVEFVTYTYSETAPL